MNFTTDINSTDVSLFDPIGDVPAGHIPDPTTATYVPSFTILVQCVMLGVVFCIGHMLKRRKVMVVHEAGVALLLGIVMGLAVKLFGDGDEFKDWFNFNNNFFFYFLLPPIIFESGWALNTHYFFKNFGAICIYAFAGTLISTFAVGFLVWGAGALKVCAPLPFLESLTFGALISATDPVTVLAIFNELGTDPNLYAYVFGESVLNDAVAIVMYRTVLSFVTAPISGRGIGAAFGMFIIIFVGSFSIGVIVGMLSAVLFKKGGFSEKGLNITEACLLVLFPYISYMLADALEFSGIVAILFAGITMKYYTAPNLSPQAIETVSSFFTMLAKLSESFVFIYMGVAMFLEKQAWKDYSFTLVTIGAILIARLANVYPCSFILNRFREDGKKVPANHQHALWFSGLRGAMAFALAVEAVKDLPSGHGRLLLTSTLFTILFTVIFIGGSTGPLLGWLKIEMHGPQSHAHGAPETVTDVHVVEKPAEAQPEVESDEEETNLKGLARSKAKFQKKLQTIRSKANFENLDNKYLKPFLSSQPRSTDSGKNQHEVEMTGAHPRETAGLMAYEESDKSSLLMPTSREGYTGGPRSRRSSLSRD